MPTASNRLRRRLMMQLGADGLSSGQTARLAKRQAANVPLDFRNLHGAWPRMNRHSCATSESAGSRGHSIRCNHSGQQGCGSQNNKIACHLNISVAGPHPRDKRVDRALKSDSAIV
jgi:hypothetical protein